MSDNCTALLKQLSSLDLFAKVGCALDSRSVKRVATWKNAIDTFQSKECLNAWGEAMNMLRTSIRTTCPERYQWNPKVNEVRQQVKKAIKPRVQAIMKSQGLNDLFRNFVVGSLVGACMELEYADLVPPSFFAAVADWYRAGHFPCGWEGDFPEGQLIVF